MGGACGTYGGEICVLDFGIRTRTENLKNLGVDVRDKWVPVNTAWGILKLWMEERPPIWRVAANILTKQPRTADKGWPPTWWLGEVLTTPHLKNWLCYET